MASWTGYRSERTLRSYARTPIRHNVSANLLAKVVGAAINLACVPFFVRALGVAGYGVVGIWVTLETVANLFDLGLSATITRELAVSTAGPQASGSTRDLLRTLESIYWLIGILLGVAVIVAAPALANDWFHRGNLQEAVIRRALVAIGVLLACRWPISLYLGGLNGLERQVFLAWVNIGFAIARNVGAIVALIIYAPTVMTFLVSQILVNSAYTGLLAWFLWQALPPVDTRAAIRLSSLRRVWRFAGGTGAIALAAFAVQDIGPVVVSKLVTLDQFGYYNIALRLTSVVYLGSMAVGTAAFPALSRLVAHGNKDELSATYHALCQLQAVLVLPVTAIVVFFGRQLIFLWTGDPMLAAQIYPVSAMLAIGSAVQCLGIPPFALQIAYGWTSLALYSNVATASVNFPLLLWLVPKYGIVGAAIAWLIVAVVVFALQTPLMHRRLLPDQQRAFYLVDMLCPLLAAAVVPALSEPAIGLASRLELMWIIPALFLLSTLSAIVIAPAVRSKLYRMFLERRLWWAPSRA